MNSDQQRPRANVEAATTIESPVGPLEIGVRDGAITMIRFGAGERRDQHPLFERAAGQLNEYFTGRREQFELPLAPPTEGLDGAVSRALAEVPFGETVSYKELTLAAGLPIERVRDVGQALGRNPIAIVLPCHRVIGADGALVGFGGGLETKRSLLDHEAPQLTLA